VNEIDYRTVYTSLYAGEGVSVARGVIFLKEGRESPEIQEFARDLFF
jgi:hypothetical protein